MLEARLIVKWIAAALTLLCALSWCGSKVHAAITIDSNGTGATDVVQDPTGTPVTLTNPLADPLDLSTENLAVGNTASGVLRIDNGSEVADDVGTIGRLSGSAGEVTVEGPGSTWSNGLLVVGRAGDGTLSISGGGEAYSNRGWIGEFSGSTGTVTVEGADSAWYNAGNLDVGNYGSGSLNIIDRAEVTVTGYTRIAQVRGGSGSITFENGTLTTKNFSGASDRLHGVGTINTRGLLSDVDLIFDANHGLNQTLTIKDRPGQNITLNLNYDSAETLGVGYGDTGTMVISDGFELHSGGSQIGFYPGSTGTVSIEGVGSTWNMNSVYIGRNGNGLITVSDGGAITSSFGFLGDGADSTGIMTVDGVGSIWNNETYVYVGSYGSGTIDISGGGKVGSNGFVSIGHNSGSIGAVTVEGAESSLSVTGSITVGSLGSGRMEILNGATVSNTYGHIARGPSGTGEVTVDGVGSSWNNTNDLIVGEANKGILKIANNGVVNVAGDTLLAPIPRGLVVIGAEFSGAIEFDGGILNTKSLYAASKDLHGTGTIYANNLVSDFDLVFDATHGLNQTFKVMKNPDQNLTVHLDFDVSGVLGIGYRDKATMSIADGFVLDCETGYIGYSGEAVGSVSIDGMGSTWNNTSLYVGLHADGILNIKNAGLVNSSKTAEVGSLYGSGLAEVDGVGSTWNNAGNLYVGRFGGNGTLNITNGGLVTVAGFLLIDDDGDGDGLVNISTGGMLALRGAAADSLAQFLGLIEGTDAIRYWDELHGNWTPISDADQGVDYALEYFNSGDLAGYTLLTVGEVATVPEPVALQMCLLAGLGFFWRGF